MNTQTGNAGTSQVGWTKTYGGTEYDLAYGLVQTSDGGYALAGSTQSFGAGGADFWLVKTDANGNAEWNKTYGGKNDDKAFAFVQTIDGGFALAGYTTSFGAGGADFWLVKTNVSGGVMWNKTYGEVGDNEARCLVRTNDGGYALVGYTNSSGAGKYDFWLVKTDTLGNMEWNMTYGGISDDEAYALVQTSDGEYVLAGWTASFGSGYRNFWLVRTNASGTIVWNQTYGGTGFDEAYALVETADGGFALAGRTSSFGAGGDDDWLIKTDASGAMMWNMTYGGTNTDDAYALVQTSDGGYALAGSTESFGSGFINFWLVKTDGFGNAQWNRTYGGTDYPNEAYALVQTSDGGCALAGATYSFGAGKYDFWLVKTDASGVVAEFPLPIILASFFVVTSSAMVLVKRKLRRKLVSAC